MLAAYSSRRLHVSLKAKDLGCAYLTVTASRFGRQGLDHPKRRCDANFFALTPNVSCECAP
jgi:hypothetical protein